MSLRLCLAAVLLLAACDGAGDAYPGPFPDLPVVSVAELQQSASVQARFTVVATVVQRTTCPPCPPDLLCAPCAYPDGVLVSDPGLPQSGVPYDYVDGVLSVEARNPERFAVGQRYRLSVEVAGTRPVYHAVLLGYAPE